MTTLNAAGLPLIKRQGRERTAQLFFRAELRCGGRGRDRSVSAIKRLVVTMQRQGSSPGAWLAALGAALTGVAQSPPPVPVSGVAEAFPALTFTQPVGLAGAGDGSNRLFLVEQGGLIRVFGNSPATAASTVFLDLRSRVVVSSEQGLLGLAFHPKFPANRFLYVNYTAAPAGDTIVARYTVSSGDPNTADPASALEILRVAQPFPNHNAGQLAFGPDGFLYIGLGDGGGGGDPLENGQNRQVLLGKMLRIDVDRPSSGRNYGIPPGNPYTGNSQGFREEIFAYGFRNPWRYSFDTLTGRLWAADVGQSRREEIDLVEKGKNYGWNTMEGSECFDPPSGCDRRNLELPIFDYDRAQGISVTGGYVYRGTGLPVLQGRYVFGDFGSGRIWTLPGEAAGPTTASPLLQTDLNISSFGVDDQQELYIVDYRSGKIFRFAA